MTQPASDLSPQLSMLAAVKDAAQRKAQTLAITRGWLAQQQQATKERFIETGDVAAMLAAHSRMMDTILSALYELASGNKNISLAVVATGGYGRAELFPYSDLDLLFLYDTAQSSPVVEFMLYILWDLGLKVGQAHRSPAETVALAKDDISIRTSLLDARFIAGKKALFDDMESRFRKEFAAETSLAFVEAKLAERDARHLRFGDSRYMLEPNVKEGKGGLRDLHTLWWMARYIYPIHQIEDLVSMKLLTPDEYKAFDQARQFLWRVRAHLHYMMERPEERLTFDRQYALAVSMGYGHPSKNRSIERFMRRYFVAVRTVGSITRIFCALLEEEKKRKPRTSLAWLWQMPGKLGNFRLDGERLHVRSEQAFEVNPVLMIEMFRVAQIHGIDIHPRALQLMARNLKRIDDSVRHDPKACGLFMDILLATQGPEIILRRMSEAGVLGSFIPDFGRVIGQTQFNMYHVYTVDEHTLVALGILHAVEKGSVKEELPLASDIIHRLKSRRVLYLAVFCHDIAKGRGGDHSELGEKIAAKLAARFGFSPDEIETAAWLVRQHLLFSNTAFKRDIDDPKTIQDFVRMVQSPERLKLLLVLTAVDIRAVGPAVWNAWKGGLLRDLYRRAEQCMGSGQVELKQHQAGQFRADLAKVLIGWHEDEIDAYLEQGNPSFWANFDLARHATIARMMRQLQAESDPLDVPLLIDTQHDYDRSFTEIILCTYDQHELFSKLAGAMALSGANIINAKIFTMKNGMVVDVFQVQDAAGQVFDRPGRLAKMSVYIEQAISDEIDLAETFADQAESASGLFLAGRNALPVPGQVFIENDASNICSVIELTGQDRTGFLYAVARTLASLGLTIATAHISTYGAAVADVFYVKDVFGMKITHDSKLKQIRAELLKAVNQ